MYKVGSCFYSHYLLFSALPLPPIIPFPFPLSFSLPLTFSTPPTQLCLLLSLPFPPLPLTLPPLSPLLLQHQILYNRAYVLCHKGRNAEAREELEKAKQIAADASESRQRIVNAALENMKVAFVLLQLFS